MGSSSYYLVEKIKSIYTTNSVVVLGDGADQILNKNFYLEDLNVQPLYNRLKDFFLNIYPKHYYYYILVKKLEQLLRINNINYVMPYAS